MNEYDSSDDDEELAKVSGEEFFLWIMFSSGVIGYGAMGQCN